ncbi:MAG: hypothetical protein ABI651_09265 [Verrucomicrobiota bacterium]
MYVPRIDVDLQQCPSKNFRGEIAPCECRSIGISQILRIGRILFLVSIAWRSHAAAAGDDFTLQLSNPIRDGNTFQETVQTVSNRTFVLEYRDSLQDTNWQVADGLIGNGRAALLRDTFAGVDQRFYRVTSAPLVTDEVGSFSLTVSPGIGLQAAYAAISAVPTLSASNRAQLILRPGTYHLDSPLILSNNYVDLIGVQGPNGPPVIQSSAYYAILQTAPILTLRNLKIDGTVTNNGNAGLLIDIPGTNSNNGSLYEFLTFANVDDAVDAGQADGTSERWLSGKWFFIDARDASLFRAPYGGFPATFEARKVTGGALSLQTRERDDSSATPSVEFDGTISHFALGNTSICSCEGLGGNIGPNALIKDGVVGNFSIALGSSVLKNALIQRITCGYGCIAGNAGASAPMTGHTDEADSRIVTLDGFPEVPPMPNALRMAFVGGTLQVEETPSYVKIEAILDPSLKRIYVSSGLEPNTTYSFVMFFEGKNHGRVSDITWVPNSGYLAMAMGPYQANNAGLIERLHVADPAADLAGIDLGYNSTLHGSTTGLYRDCHTTGIKRMTADHALWNIDNGQTLSNVRATNDLAVYLPAAVPGYKFILMRENTNFAMAVLPAFGSNDLIDGNTSLSMMDMTTVSCSAAGKWISNPVNPVSSESARQQ